jgi:ABC-type hemin transport system substrate-binding protein
MSENFTIVGSVGVAVAGAGAEAVAVAVAVGAATVAAELVSTAGAASDAKALTAFDPKARESTIAAVAPAVSRAPDLLRFMAFRSTIMAWLLPLITERPMLQCRRATEA